MLNVVVLKCGVLLIVNVIMRRHDTQNNDNQSNDIQHNDTQHIGTQHNDTQLIRFTCDTQHK